MKSKTLGFFHDILTLEGKKKVTRDHGQHGRHTSHKPQATSNGPREGGLAEVAG
jgi:hypothetical protein